jgi:Spy/CpxP family protein refolding chaperone
MKKLLVLVALFTTVYTTQAVAQGQQGGGDPAARAAKMKEVVKPQLIEKVKLTDAQADKVIDINIKSRSEMRGMRDMSEDDRKKKRAEVEAAQNKAYKDIPLTDDQIAAVNAFFEEQRKQMQQQRQNGGGNN